MLILLSLVLIVHRRRNSCLLVSIIFVLMCNMRGSGLRSRPGLLGTFSHLLSIGFLRPEVIRTQLLSNARLGSLWLAPCHRWFIPQSDTALSRIEHSVGMRSLVLQEVSTMWSWNLIAGHLPLMIKIHVISILLRWDPMQISVWSDHGTV